MHSLKSFLGIPKVFKDNKLSIHVIILRKIISFQYIQFHKIHHNIYRLRPHFVHNVFKDDQEKNVLRRNFLKSFPTYNADKLQCYPYLHIFNIFCDIYTRQVNRICVKSAMVYATVYIHDKCVTHSTGNYLFKNILRSFPRYAYFMIFTDTYLKILWSSISAPHQS